MTLTNIGLGVGAFWEVLERGCDCHAEGNAIKGKYDTIMDLIMDATAATLAGIACLWLARPLARDSA